MKSPFTSLVLCATGCFAVLQGVGSLAPVLIERGFVLPGGILAAWLLGTPATWTHGGEVALAITGLDVHVTAACSGYDFFSILATYLIFRLPNLSLARIPALLAGSWLLAVTVNALRIATCIRVRQLSTPVLPDHYQNILHQATGTLVFLSALVALAVILQLASRHESRQRLSSTLPAA